MLVLHCSLFCSNLLFRRQGQQLRSEVGYFEVLCLKKIESGFGVVQEFQDLRFETTGLW